MVSFEISMLSNNHFIIIQVVVSLLYSDKYFSVSLTVGILHILHCLEKMAFSLSVTMTDMLQQPLHGKKSLAPLWECFTGQLSCQSIRGVAWGKLWLYVFLDTIKNMAKHQSFLRLRHTEMLQLNFIRILGLSSAIIKKMKVRASEVFQIQNVDILDTKTKISRFQLGISGRHLIYCQFKGVLHWPFFICQLNVEWLSIWQLKDDKFHLPSRKVWGYRPGIQLHMVWLGL